MSKQTKSSIVFAHGLWADGSCFQKLIRTLQADGHEVICSQQRSASIGGRALLTPQCEVSGRIATGHGKHAPASLIGQ
jgi:hypothetical protein